MLEEEGVCARSRRRADDCDTLPSLLRAAENGEMDEDGDCRWPGRELAGVLA